MKKFFMLFSLLFLVKNVVFAQTQSYGIIDTADLKMTSCEFEKDANAMVLFDKADVVTGFNSTTMIRHKRIKIMSDKGKDEANVSLEYYSFRNLEDIYDVEAETINLNKNTVKFTKVEKSLIYKQTIDKTKKKITFSFPNVVVGSIIEYSYKLKIGYEGGFPDWNFQENIPVRYSELNASVRSDYSYKVIQRVYEGYAKKTKEPWLNDSKDTIGNTYSWAVTNVGSYREEPYSTCLEDNIQGIRFILVAVKFSLHGELKPIEKTWRRIGAELMIDPDFGLQLNEKLSNDDLIKEAKSLQGDLEKISYVFNYVKNSVKWNGINKWYTIDGVKRAWDMKTGNSSEINLILYNFLKQVGFKCYLELGSTRDNGKVNESNHDLSQFNKTVVSLIVNNKKYVLDASDKCNTYSEVPFDLLNSSGLFIDPFTYLFVLSEFKNDNPCRKVISVNAQISPEGELGGTAQINNFGYNKINSCKLYTTLGESKYADLLKNDNNNLKIVSFKRENMETDTLPLTDNIVFKLDLTGSDDTYIYFNPNLFTSIRVNPFISESRNSPIDFGSINKLALDGRYKIPPGYKIEVLPKSLSLVMPDKSISFKRIAAEQDGDILVNYVVNYKKAVFTKDEYPAIHDFYKKMYELLNEQIVLKKL